MTNNGIFNFNRQQHLKTWQPLPNINLQPEEIQYYEQKIRDICEKEGCDILPPSYLIELEGYETQINDSYVKYIALQHIGNLINYIKSKNVVLDDIEWNIKLILNEIITNKVSEDYYLNTIDIYTSITPKYDADIYDLINQAIRLDNKRMLYYLIFKEDEEMADRLSEVIGE